MSSPRSYRTTLSCSGIHPAEAEMAVTAIVKEFKNRPWYQNVTCTWERDVLVLQAENDFDENGLALMDEFSDVISACVETAFDGDIQLLSLENLSK